MTGEETLASHTSGWRQVALIVLRAMGTISHASPQLLVGFVHKATINVHRR